MNLRALYNPKPPKCALTCLGDLAADRWHVDVDVDVGVGVGVLLCIMYHLSLSSIIDVDVGV
jgi:hypothetical protein